MEFSPKCIMDIEKYVGFQDSRFHFGDCEHQDPYARGRGGSQNRKYQEIQHGYLVVQGC